MPVVSTSANGYEQHQLIAGQNIEVGTVTVSDDGTDLTVTYAIDEPGWVIVKAHLYVDTQAPQKHAPGQFPYHSGPVNDNEYTFTIPLADLGVDSSTELYIAAHAVVNNENNIIGYDCPTLDEIAAALPESAVIRAINYPNADSYFDVALSGGTSLDGTYEAFCIDATHLIYLGLDYTVNLYSSYEPLPDTLTTGTDPNIDRPENLDLVNWVINQDFIGQTGPVGPYTSTEVQNAIWSLIDNNPPALNANSEAIVAAAYAYGEGFVPGFGDEIAVILQPVGIDGQTSGQVTIAQVTFLQLGLECTPIYQSETSWAIADDGIPFDKAWGSYFIYELDLE